MPVSFSNHVTRRPPLVWLITMASIVPFVASAQSIIPEVPYRPQGLSTQPLVASEGAYHVAEAEDRRTTSVSVTKPYPVDTIQRVVTDAGKEWTKRIPGPIQGIQQDAGIQLLIAAGDLAQAQSVIAERTADSKLSRADKALTYLTAVQALGRQAFPDRLPMAEAYVAKLDVLGDSAAVHRHQARSHLINIYFQLGRSADIRRLGAEMVALSSKIPFNDRGVVFLPGGGGIEAYDQYVAALTSEPNFTEKIAQVNATLEAATAAPAEWIARDPWYRIMGMQYRSALETKETAVALLGKSAQPLIAHRWLHRASKDSVMLVNDGKIRILELANTSCPACMTSLQVIQRVSKALPAVQPVFLTYTYGFWGNRYIDADSEATLITQFLEERAKITIPAGIWKSKIVTNEDGGQSIESRGPNWDHYPTGKMSVWVIDGKGIVRGHFEELDPAAERQLVQTLVFLQREEDRSTATTIAP